MIPMLLRDTQALSLTMFAQNSTNTVLATQHQPTLCSTQRFRSQNSQQHGKKCVYGVFLNYTTLARMALG